MSQDHQDMLEKMEHILAEKEEIFCKRQKQLDAYHQELKNFEEELNQKISFLEEERIRIDKEKEEIEKRWEELREYEKQTKVTAVVVEKLKSHEQENLQMEQNLQKEADEFTEMKRCLENSIEQVREEEIQKPVEEEKTYSTTEVKEEALEKETDSNTRECVDDVPELLQELEAAARKKFPTGSVEDLTTEMLCVSVGDKEVRFFLKEPMNEAQIFTVRKGGGTDRALQQMINRTNQVQQDWLFSCKENHLTCTMPFTSQTDPDVIMQKCAECITTYFR